MAENSKIEWTTHTQNWWIGCTEVGPECDNCYARTLSQRYGWAEWGNHPRHQTSAANWRKPFNWNKAAAEAKERPRVFTNSLSDFFDNQVDPAWRAEAFDIIRECRNLDWLILTKRPQNMRRMLPPDWGNGWPHVWLGTTAGTQKMADQALPYLLAIPATIRFLSGEPLLGAINLAETGALGCDCPARELDDGTLEDRCSGQCKFYLHAIDKKRRIDWVIAGNESGPQRRPADLAWMRSLRDQCIGAGVPFFAKQDDKVRPLPPDLIGWKQVPGGRA